MEDTENHMRESAGGGCQRSTCFFGEYLTETEKLLAGSDQQRFYKHLKIMVGLEGGRATSEHFIRDEYITLLRD